MPRGGARNRSGPPKDPNSRTSERAGFKLTALPNEGYRGEIPDFPLGEGPADVELREMDVWRESWRTPQACAWALEPWRWPIIAEYCRLKAVVEANPAASAALVTQLHRYRDQIGLTPAGLKENGWAIATAQVGLASDGDDEQPAPVTARRRLRVAGDA